MGRQINYWMEYESFQELASAAMTKGFIIVPWNDPQNAIADVQQISQNIYNYFFYSPMAGDLILKKYGTAEKPFWRVDQLESPVIEAGFSSINMQSKTMVRNRIYVSTGHWDENNLWVARAEVLTKAYDHLARVVKKLCPYTELDGRKEYISPYCLELKSSQKFEMQ